MIHRMIESPKDASIDSSRVPEHATLFRCTKIEEDEKRRMTTQSYLLLDHNIRDWVVLPMVVLMVLMGLCRHYAQQLLKSNNAVDPMELEHKQKLMRCSRFRNRCQFLPPASFQNRKAYFTAKETGILTQKVKKIAPNVMSNPMSMMDGMKGQMLYFIPNSVMMGIISYFFHGFVLVKVPFPLTNRFKVMLQRGVDLATLDVSYVSSLSWYFLVMFGLRGLFKILLGEDSEALDEARATQAQMGMMGGMGGPPGVFDAPGAYKHERQELQMIQHSWALDDVELKLLGPQAAAKIHQRQPPSSSSGGGGPRGRQPRVKKVRKKATKAA